MPGGNRMGPLGQGPMTGRGAGYCAGYNVPGYMNPIGGRGVGFGRGGGRGGGRGRGGGGGGGWGYRNWYHATGLYGWQRAGMGWPGPVGMAPGPYSPPFSQEQELTMLRQQAASFEQALDEMKARIQELERPMDSPTSSRETEKP
ncbi:MAG: DUF5320 domain-containing protein [Bradymonadales bacterium]|nr:DUF5320 domain-containing protein [Bradymonadales bacterium]